MDYALYITAVIGLGFVTKLLLTFVAEKFPIRDRKCPCEFHSKH